MSRYDSLRIDVGRSADHDGADVLLTETATTADMGEELHDSSYLLDLPPMLDSNTHSPTVSARANAVDIQLRSSTYWLPGDTSIQVCA